MSNAAFKRGIEFALRRAADALGGWPPDEAQEAHDYLREIRAELRRRVRARRPLVGAKHKFRVRSVEPTDRGIVVTFREVLR